MKSKPHFCVEFPPRFLPLRILLGTVCSLVLATAISTAGPSTYQYFKFETLKLNNSNLIQLAEFTVSHAGALLNLNDRDGSGVNVVPVTASSGGQGEGNEDPSKAVDGSLDTKWLRSNPIGPENALVLSFTAPVTIDSYNFATANDSVAFGRTPVSWKFYGSVDGFDWVSLDARQDVPIINENKKYQAGFAIPDVVPPVINSFSVYSAFGVGNAAIVVNGGQIPLEWDTNFGDSVTLTGGGSSVTLAEGGLEYVTPPSNATTTYTLTVAKANIPDVTATAVVRAVAGGASTFRYVRYHIKKRRFGGTGLVQVGEFQFYNGDSNDAFNQVPVTAVTNPGGSNAVDGGEGANKLVDGNYGSKWLDTNNRPVIFDFGAPRPFDRYLFVTGNDAPDRDPVEWTLEGSDDQITWTLIENVNFDYPTPLARVTSSLEIPLPGPSITPAIEVFVGDKIQVVAGQPLELTYQVLGADVLELNGTPLASTSGSVTVTPLADTVYTLTATGAGGLGSSTATFSIQVIADPGVNDIAFDDFTDAGAELVLNGDAEIAGSRLRLTDESGGQLGGVWFYKKLNTTGGFEATFGMSLNISGLVASPPADGLSFIIQGDPAGTTLTGTGENGLPSNALNIKFRSYGDATVNSLMEVRAGNTVLATKVLSTTPGVELIGVPGLPETLATLTSSPAYRVRVVYKPNDLDVYFNDIAVAQNVMVDLQAIGAADSSGKSYFGFSGRTGAFVENNDITDWYVILGDFSALPPFGIVKSVFRTTDGGPTPNIVDLVWNAKKGAAYLVSRSTDLVTWEMITTATGVNGQIGVAIDNDALPEAPKAFFRVEQITP